MVERPIRPTVKLDDRRYLPPRGWATPKRAKTGRSDQIRYEHCVTILICCPLWWRCDIDTLQSRSVKCLRCRAIKVEDDAYVGRFIRVVFGEEIRTNKQISIRDGYELNGLFSLRFTSVYMQSGGARNLRISFLRACWFNYSQFQLWFARMFDCVSKGSSRREQVKAWILRWFLLRRLLLKTLPITWCIYKRTKRYCFERKKWKK